MAAIFVTPDWFFAYSIGLEIFFAIITLIVGIYAFRVYRLTEERSSRLFGTAFFFIAISYIVQATLNFVVLERLEDAISSMINLKQVYLLNLLGSYAHALLFLVGIWILTYLTLKVKNSRVFTLMLCVLLLTIFFSANKIFMFYVLSSILLLFTVIYYFMNYLNNKKLNTLLVLIAMIFLLFGALHFMFAVEHEIYYVLGHILEFIAYLLMLINLLIILKHGKKTR